MNSPYDQYNQMYPNGNGGATQVPVFQDPNAANLMDQQFVMPQQGGGGADMSSLSKLGAGLRNYTNKKGYTEGSYTDANGNVVDPSQGSFNPASVTNAYNNSYQPSGMMGAAVEPANYSPTLTGAPYNQPTNFAPTLMGGR
jgi:hypothetical protein